MVNKYPMNIGKRLVFDFRSVSLCEKKDNFTGKTFSSILYSIRKPFLLGKT